ncbi:hypothetical protein [Nocardia jiangxiensis]|uniref:hypothetical protein n=1 Tax=Nocardia jiangxiensis TaxID=282685 RepID=UPI000595045A|nr:hypothetical protein [Nocardia jiangxiensis]
MTIEINDPRLDFVDGVQRLQQLASTSGLDKLSGCHIYGSVDGHEVFEKHPTGLAPVIPFPTYLCP